MEQFDQNNISNSNNIEDELHLSDIFNFFKRNIKFLSILGFLSLIFSSIYSLTIKPTWQGEFQIVLKTQEKSKSDLPGKLRGLVNIPNFSSGKIDTQTEVEILKSPFVMKPVFKLFKEYNSKNKKGNKQLSYKKWIKSNLDIELVEDTVVLTVKYQDQNKSSIIPILNLISKEYQNYSGQDRNLGIKNSIDYVKLQIKDKREQTKKSLYALEEFSIKNNMGEFDGFIPNNFSDNESDLNTSSTSAFRYPSLFQKLETLESRLIEKSALYRKDSDVIKLLEKQIKNLRDSLERPKEILLEFRELSRQAKLDESALDILEARLIFLNIEKLKRSQPWRLISNPTLNETQIAPKKKAIVRLSVLASLILGSFYLFIAERQKDIIYSQKVLRKLIPFKFIKSINISNEEFDEKEIDFINSICFENNNSKYNFINLSSSDYLSKLFVNRIQVSTKNKKIFLIDNILNINTSDENYLLIEDSKITSKLISKFVENINLKKLKISGWFLITNKNK